MNCIHVRAMESVIIDKDWKDGPDLIFSFQWCFNGGKSKSHREGFLGDKTISYQELDLCILQISRIHIA